MGAVGLSFGSPTSGQGFNVTQTVGELVTNMQAVETPWKNQLTSLTAQDAAYTSIGTDLASLTTDLSLTDFQGVLAQKQGSSSNTNVLQLISASNSAIAGSHTISVNSLASTASYGSNAISNASDLLSGTLTFTIGSGTPVSITILSGGETLAQLSTQLNSANLGVTTNVITDPQGSLLSIQSNTSGSAGNFTLNSNVQDTSNSNAVVDFTQGQPGADASLTVDGVNITSASNTVTDAIPGVTFQALSAPVSGITATPIQVEITNDNSSVESAVKSFVTDYNKVIADINTQEGNDSSGNPEPLYGNPNLSTIQSQLQSALTFMTSGSLTANAGSGSPASWVLQAPSANDTYTLAAGTFGTGSGGTGSSAAITIPSTLAQIEAGLNTAGSGYSATLDPTGAILTVSAAATSPATLASAAPTLASSGTGSVSSITQLGIGVNNDGTLTYDSSTLDSLLNTNYQDVANFLQPGDGFTSFGANFTNALNNLGNEGPDGVVYLAMQSDQATETSLNTDVTNENATISTQQQLLTTELNQANYTLTEIPQELQYDNELYSSLSGYNVSTNG
jgi:flagellar hook-associated protein 2